MGKKDNLLSREDAHGSDAERFFSDVFGLTDDIKPRLSGKYSPASTKMMEQIISTLPSLRDLFGSSVSKDLDEGLEFLPAAYESIYSKLASGEYHAVTQESLAIIQRLVCTIIALRFALRVAHEHINRGVHTAAGAAKARRKQAEKTSTRDAAILQAFRDEQKTRGKRKTPSDTQIRRELATRFGVSYDTVLRAAGGRPRK